MEITLYFTYEVKVSRDAVAERAAANSLIATHPQ
jgi:hypothetical protein